MVHLAPSISKNSPSSSSSKTDRTYCEQLASQMHWDDLPDACRNFTPRIQSRPTDPFAGMNAGAAVEARRARSEKRESHAQIQRRMTSFGRR